MHHHAMGRSRRRLGSPLRLLTAATLTTAVLAFAPGVDASNDPSIHPQGGPCIVDAVDDGGFFTAFETQLDVPASGVLINDTTCGLTPSYGVASSGVFAGNLDGSFSYTPAAGFTGNVTVPYSLVSIDAIPIDSATITIFVAAPPCDVNLVNDAYVTPMDTALNVGAPGVGSNDVETCGSPYALVSSTSNGTLAFNADGSFDYTPNAGFVGVDVFEYTVDVPVPTFRRALGFFGWRAPAGAPTPDVATVTITIEAPPATTTTTPTTTTTIPGTVPTTTPPTTVPAPPTTVAPSGGTLPATR